MAKDKTQGTPARSPRELELEDILSDILNGYKLWHDAKVGGSNWDDQDEALARWIDNCRTVCCLTLTLRPVKGLDNSRTVC
jgi:hypothetical protein